MRLPPINIRNRNILVVTSIATKFILLFALGFRIDMWDYQNYYNAMQNIINGLAPWANGTMVYYPPLALVPMMISYLASLMGGFLFFVLSMWIILAICDIITTICIYYIGLKIYSERTAFIAALLYATAFSSAYYSLSKFDAFPLCVAMISILLTIYGEKIKGYCTSIAGFFIKDWPIILFPLFWIYNSRNTTLLKELKKNVLWIATGGAALFGTMYAAGYVGFFQYSNLIYCNTLVYTVFMYSQLVGIPNCLDFLILLFHVLAGIIILGSLYYFYKKPKSIGLLLKMSLVSIMALIFLFQYRSPQYEVWFMPIAALLLANDIRGIVIFVGVQILSFIEFPLAFYALYTNQQYTSPWALAFFTILFIAYGILLWQALKFNQSKDKDMVKQ